MMVSPGRKSLLTTLAATIVAGSLTGCATAPPASEPEALAEYRETNDPLEPTNRVFYTINNGLDTVILRPLAVAYRAAIPEVVRTHTHQFLGNLSSPVRLADDMLQGKPRRAGDTLMRMLINSTMGVAGVFEVASDWGYPAHDTDFGVTLAIWGLEDGPFLFLPLFGPSNPRDAAGIAGDIVLDPFTWVGQGAAVTALGVARFGVSAADARSRHIEDVDQIKSTALDPYATFRSLYRQNRASQIERTRDDSAATVPAWFPQAENTRGDVAPTPTPGVGIGRRPQIIPPQPAETNP